MLNYRGVRHEVTQPPDQSYRLIPLTQDQNAIVDAIDYEWLSQWNWCAHWCKNLNSFYAVRNESRTTVRMHRQIMGCTGKEQTDHLNHKTLDNRRGNLRKCTASQNLMNRKKTTLSKQPYKGIWFRKEINKWCARVQKDGKTKFLGYFASAEEAAKGYDIGAREIHGEFAKLNFP